MDKCTCLGADNSRVIAQLGDKPYKPSLTDQCRPTRGACPQPAKPTRPTKPVQPSSPPAHHSRQPANRVPEHTAASGGKPLGGCPGGLRLGEFALRGALLSASGPSPLCWALWARQPFHFI
jgi:hypothetical protein